MRLCAYRSGHGDHRVRDGHLPQPSLRACLLGAWVDKSDKTMCHMQLSLSMPPYWWLLSGG